MVTTCFCLHPPSHITKGQSHNKGQGQSHNKGQGHRAKDYGSHMNKGQGQSHNKDYTKGQRSKVIKTTLKVKVTEQRIMGN